MKLNIEVDVPEDDVAHGELLRWLATLAAIAPAAVRVTVDRLVGTRS